MNDVKEQAPDKNSFNEIDLYLAACTIHVFGAIMEYAIILFVMKTFDLEWNKKLNKCRHAQMIDCKVNVISAKEEDTQDASGINCTNSNLTVFNVSVAIFFNLDWISLSIFPLCFAAFNIFYWSRIDMSSHVLK